MLEYFIIATLVIVVIWIALLYLRLWRKVEDRAISLYDHWRERDLSEITTRMSNESSETIRREVELQSRDWRMREGERIRQDAIKRSREVIHGKVTEHLIPYFPAFPWNPSDARFLGSPIDFIIFDGLSEGAVREIIFVEVKSGARKVLSPRERSVARCVERGEISFRTIHPDDR